MKVKDKFLKYVKFDTQSDENSTTCPSTMKQKELGKFLVEQLKAIGVPSVKMDGNGYVYAKLPGNIKCKKTLGLIAHMDTSPDAPGNNIHPQECQYEFGDLYINDELAMYIPEEQLVKHVGHRLITTDGTTLLGADDKAGIAIIMETIETIINQDLPHPNIHIAFTPDEEIGMGTSHFDVEYFKKGAGELYSYTLDGGDISVINYENFNAASAKVNIKGVSIHPGSAKGVMVNSALVAMEFISMLPPEARPENTEGYEGFNHLHSIEGDVTNTKMAFIIRNHDMEKFNAQKELFKQIEETLNKKYGLGTVEVRIKDSYFNMKELVFKNQT